MTSITPLTRLVSINCGRYYTDETGNLYYGGSGMPTIRYSCEVKYENGKVRPKGECANCCVDVTEEEYIKLVQGISEGKTLPDISGIDEVLNRMRDNVIRSDSFMNLNGTYRDQALKTPRKIESVEVFLDKQFIGHIRSLSDPVGEMTRPEQIMTVYRSDGSSVEIRYRRGEVEYRDSRKKGTIAVMTVDSFLSRFAN